MSEKDKPDDLLFKPITEGLGFHPFSTGLPYSPPQKKEPPAGATAAGVPRFVKTIPSTRVAIPTPVAPSALAPTPVAKPVVTAPVAASPEPLASPLKTENDYGAVYVFKRLLAFGIDAAFHLLLALGGVFGTLWLYGSDSSNPVTDDMLLIGFLLFIVGNWTLMTLEEVAFKTTLGKRLLGLRFEGVTRGTLLLRAFAFPVSLFFFGLGIVWALFDSKKRCWHDLAAKAQPVEMASL